MIFTDQPLKLESTVTVNGATVPDPVTAATYEFWKPGNTTDTPTGTWTADIVDENTGEISYNILANVLDEPGIWKLQATATVGGLTYPSEVDSLTVKSRGEM